LPSAPYAAKSNTAKPSVDRGVLLKSGRGPDLKSEDLLSGIEGLPDGGKEM